MKIIRELQGGGSSAGVLLVEDEQGREVVLKFANWSGIGSNGIPWLKAQFVRLKELKKSLSLLGASRIPEVYDFVENDEGVYYTVQYYQNGEPLSIYHFERFINGSKEFLHDLDKLLTFMSEEFYSQGRLEVPSGYLERVYLSRLDYRLGLLYRNEGEIYERLIKNRIFKTKYNDQFELGKLFEQLWKLNYISINNTVYLNPRILIETLKRNSIFLKHIEPSFLPKFAHGDGLLRNFMKIPDGRTMVFDVRGTELPDNSPARIDIPYELGKFLHGILLEIIRHDLFDLNITRATLGLNFEINYDLSDKRVINFLEVRKKMPELFRNNTALNKILEDESRWLQKAFFAEATHFLTDAVNRLENDQSSKHAIAYYLVGTMLLNEYFSNFY